MTRKILRHSQYVWKATVTFLSVMQSNVHWSIIYHLNLLPGRFQCEGVLWRE